MPASRPAVRQFEINIRNEYPHPEVSDKELIKVINKIFKDLGFKKAMISVLLVGDRRMRALNRQYLKHAWSTDVLAFGQGKITKTARVSKVHAPSRRTAGERAAAGKSGEQGFLGDIVLCIPTIEDQAEEYGHTFKEELDYCLCHGILHLIGHEDKTRTGHTHMHRKQSQILRRIKKRA